MWAVWKTKFASTYALWEASGKTDGSEMDFWLQAEREIGAEASPEPRRTDRSNPAISNASVTPVHW